MSYYMQSEYASERYDFMDDRRIGVFDSGLGGLTGLRELVRVLPHEDVVYFGDTGRVPYGGRSADTIARYTADDIRFLRGFDVKAILVACGTASTVLGRLGSFDIPVLGVIEPAAEAALAATKNGRVGIIGTAASIRSGAYERALGGRCETFAAACPLFVPLVENGRFRRGDVVIETIAREYLEPMRDFGCDTLILGCTHYPLLGEIIADILPGVTLIDPGARAADKIGELLAAEGLETSRSGAGSVEYYVSDDPEGFSRLASIFMGREVREDATKVEI